MRLSILYAAPLISGQGIRTGKNDLVKRVWRGMIGKQIKPEGL